MCVARMQKKDALKSFASRRKYMFKFEFIDVFHFFYHRTYAQHQDFLFKKIRDKKGDHRATT